MLYQKNIQKGLVFDGVNDFVDCGAGIASQNFHLPTSTYSISVWLKSNIGTRQQIVSADINNSADNRTIDFYILNATTILAAQIDAVNGYIIQSTIPTITTLGLFNLVLVKNGNNPNNWNFYLNGVLLSKTIILNTLPTITAPNKLSIGTYYTQNANFFNGNIKDFKIFNTALSPVEVSGLYNGIVPSGLIADYRFTDQSGFTLSDFSGNANNGTLINYTAGDVTIGANNKWIYEDSTPYTALKKDGILKLLKT